MLFWLLVVFAGVAGCVVFGVPLGMDVVYGAQFKKAAGSVPGVIQRSIRGSLRPFLLSLGLVVVGLLLMSVCSRRAAPKHDDEAETRVRGRGISAQCSMSTPRSPGPSAHLPASPKHNSFSPAAGRQA